MQRKAVRLLGLVLVGAAAFACLRRWLHRADDDRDDSPPASAPPALVPVPDLEPESEPEAATEVDAAPAAPADPAVAEPMTSWVPPVGEACPDGYPVKVNERSGIYHVPGGLSYERTRPTRCYPDEASAEADGFRRAKR